MTEDDHGAIARAQSFHELFAIGIELVASIPTSDSAFGSHDHRGTRNA